MSISSIVIGTSFYEKYKMRPDSLSMFINLLNNYRLRLKMERKSFCDVVLSCETDDAYLNECKNLLYNKTVEQAFIIENTYFNNLCISTDDKIILQNFFRRTGSETFKEELIVCDETLSALELQLTESKRAFKKSGNFSLKIAIAVALWIMVVLL